MHWRSSRRLAEAGLAGASVAATWLLLEHGVRPSTVLLLLAGAVALQALQTLVRRALVDVDPEARTLTVGNWPELYGAVESASAALSVPVPHAVVDTEQTRAPALDGGMLRPTLLLSEESLAGLDRAEVEAIVAHELAHAARRHGLRGILRWLAVPLCGAAAWVTLSSLVFDGGPSTTLSGLLAVSFVLWTVDVRLGLPFFVGTGFVVLPLAIAICVAERADEFEADAAAAQATGAEPLAASTLHVARLQEDARITNWRADWTLADRLWSSHPPLEDRVEALGIEPDWVGRPVRSPDAPQPS